MIDRRTLLASGLVSGAALAASPVAAKVMPKAPNPAFPQGFLWGASTAAHQIEGNNTNSDLWFLENIKQTAFTEPSRDAANSFEMWPQDLDLAQAMGLNCYRFSIEWARIEPEPGLFSQAMLDHYKRMIAGCKARGLAAIVTFNHFTAPRWFSAQGGWLHPDSASLFARFCDKAARHLGDGISHAITFNEPNILRLLKAIGLPQFILDKQRAMLDAAAKAMGTAKFISLNVANPEDVEPLQVALSAAHGAGKAAIKAAHGALPVGLCLAMFDDQAVGRNSLRDAKRRELYGNWLEVARQDDFLGVQNYERAVWNDKGKLPAPAGAAVNFMGSEVYAPSLAGAVRYAHAATGVPILITEHGVGTNDDGLRASFIPAALAELKKLMDEGVPVQAYCHWSLIDNFEWIFGYAPKFGLHSVDPVSFARTAKPSAAVYGAIARRNSL
jgi:beta-glucosidase